MGMGWEKNKKKQPVVDDCYRCDDDIKLPETGGLEKLKKKYSYT
ncbi:MAG: hypothetical protein ACP5IE_00215 [Infirmifilum sp.]